LSLFISQYHSHQYIWRSNVPRSLAQVHGKTQGSTVAPRFKGGGIFSECFVASFFSDSAQEWKNIKIRLCLTHSI